MILPKVLCLCLSYTAGTLVAPGISHKALPRTGLRNTSLRRPFHFLLEVKYTDDTGLISTVSSAANTGKALRLAPRARTFAQNTNQSSPASYLSCLLSVQTQKYLTASSVTMSRLFNHFPQVFNNLESFMQTVASAASARPSAWGLTSPSCRRPPCNVQLLYVVRSYH